MAEAPWMNLPSHEWVSFLFIILVSVILGLFGVLLFYIPKKKRTKKEPQESIPQQIPEYCGRETKEQTRDELILDLIRRGYEEEANRIKDLDGKAETLAGFTSIVLSLLIGAGALQLLQLILKNPLIGTLYYIGIGFLLASIIFSLLTIRIRYYLVVPNTNRLLSLYINRSYKETLRTNAGQMAKSLEYTRIKNQEKARLIQIGWYLLIIGLSIFFVFLGVLLFGVDNQQLIIPSG